MCLCTRVMFTPQKSSRLQFVCSVVTALFRSSYEKHNILETIVLSSCCGHDKKARCTCISTTQKATRIWTFANQHHIMLSCDNATDTWLLVWATDRTIGLYRMWSTTGDANSQIRIRTAHGSCRMKLSVDSDMENRRHVSEDSITWASKKSLRR